MIHWFTPFRSVLFFGALTLCGLLCLPLLTVRLNPTEKSSELYVSVSLPNSPPSVVEREAVALLESTLSRLQGLKAIRSVSRYHEGEVTLEFDRHTDLALRKMEASVLLREVWSRLPFRASFPQLSESSRFADDGPLLIYSLSGPATNKALVELGEERLCKPLRQLAGVHEVKVQSPVQPSEIRMTYQPEQWQALGLQHGQVTQAIGQAALQYFPGNYVSPQGQLFSTQVPPLVSSAASLNELPIAYAPGVSVPLRMLARITEEAVRPLSHFRINGAEAVRLLVYPHRQANLLTLADEVRLAVGRYHEELPLGFRLDKEFDQTLFLQTELTKVYERTAFSLVALSVFLLLVYRKVSFLTGLLVALLVNSALTFLGMFVLQIPVHLYTLAGLAVSFGLVLDNSIVVLSHLQRYANRKVALPLLAATFTTVAALLLVFFLPEEQRQSLTEFVQVTALGLLVSLPVSFFFIPAWWQLTGANRQKVSVRGSVLAAGSPEVRPEVNTGFFKKKRKGRHRFGVKVWLAYGQLICFLQRKRGWVIGLSVWAFGLPVFMLPAEVEGWSWYNQTVGHRRYQEDIRPYVEKWLGGSLRLFVREVYEKAGYRANEATKLVIEGSFPVGIPLPTTNGIFGQVEHFLGGFPQIDRYLTTVASGQYGRIEITFKEAGTDFMFPYQLKNLLIARSLDWGSADWNVYGVGKGFSNAQYDTRPIMRAELRGFNYEALGRLAEQVASTLLQHPRVQAVDTEAAVQWREKSGLQLQADLPKALLLPNDFNFGLTQLAQRTQPFAPNGFLPWGIDLKPWYLRAVGDSAFSLHQFGHQTVNLPNSATLQPGKLYRTNLKATAPAIYKENREYLRMIRYEYFGGGNFAEAHLEKTLKAEQSRFPLGYRAQPKQFNFMWNKERRPYYLLAGLLAAIFGICAILFESLRKPFLVITAIPVGYIGIFLTFSQFRVYFDQGGYAAFVLLGGLVVNAVIFVLSDAGRLKGKHQIVRAIRGKASAIWLTVLSTVMGMLPFLTGGNAEVFWYPLAAGTIGGLVFSMLAVFILLPVLQGSAAEKKPGNA